MTSVLDLQHELLPEFFSRAELAYRRRVYGWSVRNSRLVITISSTRRARSSSGSASPRSAFARSISASTTSCSRLGTRNARAVPALPGARAGRTRTTRGSSRRSPLLREKRPGARARRSPPTTGRCPKACARSAACRTRSSPASTELRRRSFSRACTRASASRRSRRWRAAAPLPARTPGRCRRSSATRRGCSTRRRRRTWSRRSRRCSTSPSRGAREGSSARPGFTWEKTAEAHDAVYAELGREAARLEAALAPELRARPARGSCARRRAAGRPAGSASRGSSSRSTRSATTSSAASPTQEFSGRCLDVSSPKLLPSLLQAEGRGRWTCIDLFEREIAAWRTIDPALDLDVQDATALPYEDETFDNCICVSVLEHVGAGKDAEALAEMWRVLKPGGVLHLTADVAAVPQDVFLEKPAYGEGAEVEGRASSSSASTARTRSRRSSPACRGRCRSSSTRRSAVRGSSAGSTPTRPGRTLAGPFLRFVCPGNFVDRADTALRSSAPGSGVVYARLREAGSSRARAGSASSSPALRGGRARTARCRRRARTPLREDRRP